MKFCLHVDDKKIWLTPQESRCLGLLSKGFSAKWIARELNISSRTVDSYVASIKKKSNLYSRNLILDHFHKTFITEKEGTSVTNINN